VSEPSHPKHHPDPYVDPDYNQPPHQHEPPDNPKYPSREIYGEYASKRPPRYLPHPFDHTCFRPRKDDYKRPMPCYEVDDDLCHRKDQRKLTTDEQNRFLTTYIQINLMGALGPLVDIHANSIHQMHGNPRFLPWHRIYLLRMEQLLHMVDPSVCIPYWNSSEEQAFPSWLLSFSPTVNLITGQHTVTRTIGMFATLPDSSAMAAATANATFTLFGQALEGIHNTGHVWVGGSMGLIPTAPADPVFWMHHAEMDRRWHLWQQTHPGEHPALSGSAATMDPWTETEVDTRDITALGVAYE
jgi:tyrosinase